MKISRRSALGLIGAGAALPAAAATPEKASTPAFRHGVASGDPSVRGAILWTRVSPSDAAATAAIPVRWSVSETETGPAVESGTAEARPARDFTVKVEARRLKPGRDYWYWFEAGGVRSPLGRFRTLPQGKVQDAVLAIVSCQLFGGGLYNAYETIAGLSRIDAIVHLGDYIYEYASDHYGGASAKALNRTVEPDREIVTLADYRLRHASYKLDSDLQAAHARAAFIAVWDDHETSNDSWTGGAQNHQPETEGDWKARKAAALQAYFEWMPIRDPQPGKPWESINRSFQFGDLASLLMVETRLLARSQQADERFPPIDAASLAQVVQERSRADREMLGEPQRRWLENELKSSVAARRPWQVIGNQVVMARVPGPDLVKTFGADKAAAMLASLPADTAAAVRKAQAAYAAGLPFNIDSWDGYPAARERLYASFRHAGAQPIVLSGDSHAFWANDLHDASGALVGSEFGTSAITSPSPGDSLPGLDLGALLAGAGDEVRFCDQHAKGYVLLTLDHAQARADYVAVPILEKPFQARTIASFSIASGTRTNGVRAL